jgi:large subunit ribosomal protein L10
MFQPRKNIMLRAEKPKIVQDLSSIINDAEIVIVTRQSGLTVKDVSALRGKVRAIPGSYQVAKNTLAKLAVKDTKAASLSALFKGATAIAAANDPVALAKAIDEVAGIPNPKLEIVGGLMGNKTLSAAEIKTLAKLPSLDVLRGQLIGLIMAPATKIARVVQTPGTQVARVLSAYATKE